jgi:transaldolase
VARIWIDSPDTAYLEQRLESAVTAGDVYGVILDKDHAVSTEAIRKACDALAPIYARQEGGYIALRLDAAWRDDTKRLLSEASAWIDAIDRPNTMIAVPATDAGMEAIASLAQTGHAVCATHLFSSDRALRAAEALSGAKYGLVSVSISPFDRKLNPKLKQHNLAQNRIGFFVGTKIYNQIEALDHPHLHVAYAEMDGRDAGLESTYYVENLTLPNTVHFLSPDVAEKVASEGVEESFHFQTRHLDAFFSYLTPAGISLGTIESELWNESF